MADEHKPVRIVPREKAAFRLDENGVWRCVDDNEKFLNHKIINYFHSMIKKDQDGFFLEQEHTHFIEKVYFTFEDTPLFVFQVFKKDGLILRLNTGRNIRLDPEKLFTRDDHLYIRQGGDIIKFSEKALWSLAEYLYEQGGQFGITINGERYPIPGIVEQKSTIQKTIIT